MKRVAILLIADCPPRWSGCGSGETSDRSSRCETHRSVQPWEFSPAIFSTSPVRADATPREHFRTPSKARRAQTLQNVKAIVEAAGLTMEHVVYSQVYLNDMAHYDAMERVWKEFFPKAPPARAVLGVYRLPTDIAVEINAVAFRDLTRKRRIVPAGSPQNLSWSPGMMAGNRLYLSGFTRAPTWRRAGFRRTRMRRCNSRSTT